MMDITLLGVVLIFLSVGMNIQTAESCRCYPFHPQYHFCNSEIVILADVIRPGIATENDRRLIQYEINIIKELRGFKIAKGIKYVYAYQDGAMCGIKLDKKRYVLSGYQIGDDGFTVGMCNLVKRWDDLSLTDQENLDQTYKTGCNCTISPCFKSPCCPQSKKECVWKDSPNPLEYACLEDSDGTCSWYRAGLKAPVDPQCKPKGSSFFSFLKKIFG